MLTPVTSPLASTVATPRFDEDHIDPTTGADPVNCIVAPIQPSRFPVIVGGVGTVKKIVVSLGTVLHPLLSVTANVYGTGLGEAEGRLLAIAFDCVGPVGGVHK